jgi:NTE family protein
MQLISKILSVFLFFCFAATSLQASEENNTIQELLKQEQRPKIALVLSGGGARGISQIGIIKEFERQGIPIDYIVGTSIGAVVGGLYSVGYTGDELDSLITTANWDEISSIGEEYDRSKLFLDKKALDDRSLITLRFDNYKFEVPEGVSAGIKFSTFLQKIIWNGLYANYNDFDQLKVPFRAVATDLVNGETVVLKSGNLSTSIRASATIPLQYKPVRLDSMVLIDGGLLANIPVEQAKEFDSDIIIAINTTSDLMPDEDLNSLWNILDQSMSLMMKKRSDKSISQADYVIKPDLNGHDFTDFSDLDSVVKLGELSARRHIKNIKELIAKKQTTYKNTNKQPKKITKINFSKGKRKCDSSLVRFFEDKYLGAYIDYNTIKELKQDVLRQCRQNKKSITGIRRFDINQDNGIIDIELSDSKICDIVIEGNDNLSDFIILREMEFEKCQTVNTDKIIASWENLISSGLYSDVEISLKESTIDSGLALAIKVKENGSQLISLGARIDNERFAQGGIDFIKENLFDIGARATVRIAGGSRNQFLSFSIENQRIFSTMLTSSYSAYYSAKDIYKYEAAKNLPDDKRENFRVGEFQENRFGFKAYLGKHLERKGRIYGEYRYERQRFYDTLGGAIPPYSTVSTLKFGTIFDSEDKSDFPTRGILLDMSLETSVFSFVDQMSFSKITFDISANQSWYGGNHTLSPRIYFGFADRNLPEVEFYSFGGQDVFYGIREDEERGRQIAVASIEYRYKFPIKILFDTYLSMRYDIGSSWLNFEEIKFSGMRHGIGFNLGIDTPVGPAKFAIGQSFRFLKKSQIFQWNPLYAYFSIGTRI